MTKPTNSAMRHWLQAARVIQLTAVLVLAVALAALAYGLTEQKVNVGASSGDAAGIPGHSRSTVSTRHDLIRAIAERPLRRQPHPPATAETRPTAPVVVTPPIRSVDPPPFEIVATCTDASGSAKAFVRKTNRPSLIEWKCGATEGPFTVTEVGDGWVKLHSSDGAYTLRVTKRQPRQK